MQIWLIWVGKSSLILDSNPWPLAYCSDALQLSFSASGSANTISSTYLIKIYSSSCILFHRYTLMCRLTEYIQISRHMYACLIKIYTVFLDSLCYFWPKMQPVKIKIWRRDLDLQWSTPVKIYIQGLTCYSIRYAFLRMYDQCRSRSAGTSMLSD
jgi:hypothetical protein